MGIYLKGPFGDIIDIDAEIDKGVKTVAAVEEEKFTPSIDFDQIRQTVSTTDTVTLGYVNNYDPNFEYVLIAQKGVLNIKPNEDDSSVGDIEYTADTENVPDIIYLSVIDYEHGLLLSKPTVATVNMDSLAAITDGIPVDINAYIIDTTLYIRNNE